MRILPFILALLASIPGYTQNPDQDPTQNQAQGSSLDADLLFYGDVMVNAIEASSRTRAANEFSLLFDQWLEQKNSIEDQAFLKFTSITESPDSLFQLLTWQIQKEDYIYDFKGYILFASGKIIELQRTEPLSASMAYQTSNEEDWYGCMYYNIMKTQPNQYLLFGFDASSKYDNQKLIDVLTINGDNITFGSEIFEDLESPDTYLNRLIVSYTSDAAVNLNYSPALDLILQDHLESTIGLQAGQGSTHVPDGTYIGYVEKDGKWMYKQKIYDHVYEKAPRPKPVKFNQTPKPKRDVKMK